ncbi:class F sortase [Streptomyces canus]|uniref:class F sortase n=1 Tax=Streptomyces canus TaxID=58343 RepID=UPI002E30A9ED|nr:class F sortase [Streptomyces canus]
MAPRRRRRRPWYRTRAYRLTRTALLTVVLVTVGVRCTGDDKPTVPYGPDGQDTVAAAGPDAEVAGGPDVEVTREPDADVSRGPDAEVTREPGADVSRGPGVDVSRGLDADVSRGPAPSARPTPTRRPPLRPLPRSRPTSFRIPSLGIDAPITGLGLIRGRELATPPVDKPKLVGWYQGGPTPGEPGTAIAVGHRDTRTGPAVFAALAQVKPGKVIEAGRADGRTAVYTVDRVKVFDKEGFPDKEVYGPARRPELRVITCGGLFKWRTGYTSNVVVFAHLTRTREPRPPKSTTAR